MNPMALIFFAAMAVVAPISASNWGGSGYAAPNWAAVPANIALSQDGKNVLDTPEVAAAKSAHLAALAQAQSHGGNSNDDGSYDPRWENENYQEQAAHSSWNGAPAAQSWNAAPAQSWNSAPAQSWNSAPAQSWNSAPAQSWNGKSDSGQWSQAPAQSWSAAPAPIQLSSDGHHVLDTPEVAQARAAHLAAHASAGTHSAPAPSWNGAPSWQAGPSAHAPAQVRLSHDGSNILDTPEVAQARAAHLAAHAQAAAHAGPAPAHNQW